MITYEQVIRSLKKRNFSKLYLLVGEEPYYIDKLCEYFETLVISEAEKDFNQTILYGDSVSAKDIINEAMRFPMMSDYQLVVVHEAQQVKDVDTIAKYIESIPTTTILVLCIKKKPDKRKALYKIGEELGSVFESVKIPDYKIPDTISSMAAGKNLMIDPRSANMLADFLGNDLEKISSELDKLAISLGNNDKVITSELIERNIGISKDFNNFEFLKAVIEKDVSKAYLIASHFAKNEQANPIQSTLAVLFNYFTNLLIVLYPPRKDEQTIMSMLGFRNKFQVRDYITGMRFYSLGHVFNIIRQIRLSDAASKGIDSNASNADIMKELLAVIFR
ncbi:DNA polymerase III subunit delta [Porphyromonas pogonae]|uniref:DNA polymerase III subunit delta n=1 Tax=Porphyromonas pogonae TaxID=867595 RepID=UPI002E79FB17|nr:DNA polymerase III subunit delta [Porphyromonas pogonae]